MAITAEKVLEVARAQVGVKATDIKRCKYNTEYYGSEVSGSAFDWCAAFVWWVFKHAGGESLLYGKTANCGSLAVNFNRNGRLMKSGFKPGDVVLFHWSATRSTMVSGFYSFDHVGIIEKCNADGSYKTDTWIGNYYVDSSGCMLRNGWTPDGYWVGNDGAWEPQWGQRHDDVAPWPGKPYRGTYTYVFYRDVYGDGVEHWSAKESISFSSLTKTYEMYPVGRSYYMMMDILSGDVYGSVSFSPDRSVAYVNLGGVPQRCEIEW